MINLFHYCKNNLNPDKFNVFNEPKINILLKIMVKFRLIVIIIQSVQNPENAKLAILLQTRLNKIYFPGLLTLIECFARA